MTNTLMWLGNDENVAKGKKPKKIKGVRKVVKNVTKKIKKFINKNTVKAVNTKEFKMKNRKRIKRVKRVKSGLHRIVAYNKGGIIRTSRKARVVRRNLKLNPFKIKGLTNMIMPTAYLAGATVATMYGLNKGISYIPYVKTLTGWQKSVAKLGLGIAGFLLSKKYIKKDAVSNGILVGSVISAISDYINITGEVPATTTAGLSIADNKFTTFGTARGVKTTKLNLNGFKFSGADVAGYQERY